VIWHAIFAHAVLYFQASPLIGLFSPWQAAFEFEAVPGHAVTYTLVDPPHVHCSQCVILRIKEFFSDHII
jgi:hypothetical protein